ncbi:MAG TPA: ABC transporter ATP-binding protein [Polyangiaceae bacterium]
MVAAATLPTGSAGERDLLIALDHVSKDYDTGGGIVHAMRDVNLHVEKGEFVAIVGTSGSGKSTMMNILGCLDRPTRGTYTLAEIDVGSRAGDSRAIVRNRLIGFIFQGFNLLPRTTALENVELPLQYRGVSARSRRKRAKAALEAVNLGDRMDHKPNQLSGGQQQRVAIARALVTDPPLLLADEPTGNLDTRTSLEVLALLQRLNRDRGITIVLVTHERDIAACASRVVTMRDGRIVSDVRQEQPLDAAAELAALPVGGDDAGPSSQHGSEQQDTAASKVGGPVPWSVYPIMWLGDALGYAIGAVYVTAILGTQIGKAAWIPLLLGELTKGWAGARWLRRKLGKPSTSDQRVRTSLWYTLGTLAFMVLGFIGMLAANKAAIRPTAPLLDALSHAVARGTPILLVVFAAIAGCLVLLRYLLLSLFNARK